MHQDDTRHKLTLNKQTKNSLQITFKLLYNALPIMECILFNFIFFTAEPMDEYSSIPASIAERYKVGRTLGDGNFAVVRECVERSTGREYALKIISKDKCRGKVSLLCTCGIQLLHHQISNVHKVEVQLLLSHFFKSLVSRGCYNAGSKNIWFWLVLFVCLYFFV